MLLIGIWFVFALVLSCIWSAWRLMHVFIGFIERERASLSQDDSPATSLVGKAIALRTNIVWSLYVFAAYAFAVPFAILVGILFVFNMCFTSLQRWFSEHSWLKNYQTRLERGELLEELGTEIDRQNLLPGLKRKLKAELGLAVESETQSAEHDQALAQQYEAIDNFPSPQILKNWLKSFTVYKV
jgi:hypothetical protein